MALFDAGDQSLTIVLKVRDEFSAALKTAQGSLERMEPAFRDIRNAGAIAFGGIAVAVKTSLDAFEESETATVRLAHVLKTSRGATEAQIKTLIDQSEALERVGVVSADVIKVAQGTFATFDLQAESIRELTPAFLDMVVAERGVNATTDDMISFANSLGQALQGNYTSLSKRGFILDEDTKRIIENGNETERIAAIVRVLNSTYEGLNETQRNTAAGLEKGLLMTFDRMRQSVGEALAPAIGRLTESLLPLIERMASWIEANPDLAAKILLVSGAVAGLVTVVGMLGLALPAIIGGLTLLMGPAGAVIAILGVLTLTVRQVSAVFDTLMNHSGEVWAGIKEYFKEGVNFLVGLAEGWANGWVSAVNTIIGALNKIKFSIPDWVPKVGGKSFGIDIPLAPEVKLPRFEFGGMVPGARGEAVPIMAHGGERVIPAGGSAAGSINISVVINNPVVQNREDANVLRRQIDDAMRDLIRGHKLATI